MPAAAAAAAPLHRLTSLETGACPSPLNASAFWLPHNLPGSSLLSFSASVTNASFLLAPRTDGRRVKYINRQVWWTVNLPLDSNSLIISVCEHDPSHGAQCAQVSSRVGSFPKSGKYDQRRISTRSPGKQNHKSIAKQTSPNSKSAADLDVFFSHNVDSAGDYSLYADKTDMQRTWQTNHEIGHGQGRHHNYRQPTTEAAQINSEKAPAFTSKLEEILSKFKKKPGFHTEINKDPAHTGHKHTISQNEIHIRRVGAEQVQERNVSINSKQGAVKSLRSVNVSPYIQENGRKNTRHNKKGWSDRNNAIDMLGEMNPSKNDLEDVFQKNAYLDISGNHHPAWESEMPCTSLEDSHVRTQKRPMSSKARMSGSIGSRSSPSRSSDSGSTASNARYKKRHNQVSEKRRDDWDISNMIFELGKASTNDDNSQAGILDQNVHNVKSSDADDADCERDSWSTGLEHQYDHDSSSAPLAASQQSDLPTLSVSDNESNKGSYNISLMDNNVFGSNHNNGGVPDVASWHKHSIPDLPFDFQYSYTENPKVPIVRYREVPFSPFGPPTMSRPWTGRAPLKPSKKKLPEFDSFKPPPKGKKGVKFVQNPGPYPDGKGPKLSRTWEEIMGEPLTKEEIIELVDKSHKERRQLNLGRDGLTHNMLDLIHCHWKRRRVCRIKCIGVPTVDMDNVCFHIEDKTGGKVIYQTGGVLYLFRGRNYNYKDRPKIPIMLWKPVTPVYPKLIQEAPEGLTKEEAKRLCQLGEKVEPMCKLAKNGVYLTLVEDVRAALRIDDLVRIDCQGLNPSDYKKIGAKLKDLVPCVLLSFDNEHILMWKGKTIDSTPSDKSPTQNAEHEFAKESISPDTVAKENFKENMDCTKSVDFMLEQEENAADVSSTVVEHPFILETSSIINPVNAEQDVDSKQEKSPDKKGRSNNKVVCFDDLWDGALASGMALELSGGNLDTDTVVKKVTELAASAPVGPTYTERLISKLKIKTEQESKAGNELRIHFGKLKKNVKKRNQLANPSLKDLYVDVPESGGLPVSELASLLAPR